MIPRQVRRATVRQKARLRRVASLFTIGILIVLGALPGCDKKPKTATPAIKTSREQRLPAQIPSPSNLGSAVQYRSVGSKLPFYELKMEPNDITALERNAF